MGTTVQQCESFQWTTDVNKLVPTRWSSSQNLSLIGSPGPYGTGSYLRMAASAQISTLAWIKSGALFCEFSLRVAALGGGDIVQGHTDSVSSAVSLGINNGGQLFINFPTAGGSVAFPANIGVGNWYRIQWTVLFGNPGKTLIWVNGNEITGGGYIGNFQFFGDYAPVTFWQFRYPAPIPNADWSNIIWGFITDAAVEPFPADQYAILLRPSADSAVAWTPTGAGTNTACLTQAAEPDGDVTYNSSVLSGNQDLFDTTPPLLTGTVNLVSPTVVARKNGAGANFITPSVKTNGFTVQGTSIGQGATYQGFSDQYVLNPVTGLAWTVAELNLIKLGYRNSS